MKFNQQFWLNDNCHNKNWPKSDNHQVIINQQMSLIILQLKIAKIWNQHTSFIYSFNGILLSAFCAWGPAMRIPSALQEEQNTHHSHPQVLLCPEIRSSTKYYIPNLRTLFTERHITVQCATEIQIFKMLLQHNTKMWSFVKSYSNFRYYNVKTYFLESIKSHLLISNSNSSTF